MGNSLRSLQDLAPQGCPGSNLSPSPYVKMRILSRHGFSHGSDPKRVTVNLCNWSATWPAVQCTIQVERGADQGEMREGLRKVSERFAASPYLFGVQPQMIGVSQHPFKQQPGFCQFRTIDSSCPGERFHQPKRTQGKRAFSPCEPICSGFAVVTIHEAIGDQSSLFR